MALTPEEIRQQIAKADQAIKDQAFNQAITILNVLLNEDPESAPAYRRLGAILMHSQLKEQAIAHINKAIGLAPKDSENWKVLGEYHKMRNEWVSARKAFTQALLFSKENSLDIHYELFKTHRILGDHASALPLIQKLSENAPENIIYTWEYAKLHKEMGQEREALTLYTVLINSSTKDIPDDILIEWLSLMQHLGQADNAHQWLRKQIEAIPKNTTLKLLYGRSCYNRQMYNEALLVLEEAYRLDPDNIEINWTLGGLHATMNHPQKSIPYYMKILEREPFNTNALKAIAMTHTYRYGDDAFKRLNIAAANLCNISTEQQITMRYTLGKAYDDVGDIKTAFSHFQKGGTLHNRDNMAEREYNNLSHLVDLSKKEITKETFGQHIQDGCQSNKPIFIVGMPRSGTTLIEQVLSSIGGVFGAGELPYTQESLNGMEVNKKKLNIGSKPTYVDSNAKISYKERGESYLALIESLAPPSTQRIIDKMPHNFVYLDFIHLILPNATIIHSRRHPVEICLSAYRIHFPFGHYWSDDLRTMGRYYRLYHELMQHWKSVLPEGAIFDVRYENMVSDLEIHSKRLATHIGMPWSKACLAFHKSDRAVHTASLSQVRQPIYRTSMNRWRKYEPYLQPLLDEIGDLVETYEMELASWDQETPTYT